MKPSKLLEIIESALEGNSSVPQFAKLYERQDLINDIYIKAWEIRHDPNFQLKLSAIIKACLFSRYRNKGNPQVAGTEIFFQNSQEKEISNHEITSIMITESKDRLSQLIDLDKLKTI